MRQGLAIPLVATAFLATVVWLAAPAAAHEAENPLTLAERAELTFGRSAAYDYDPPEPGSYRLPVFGKAADGAVLAPDGSARSLHGLMDGRLTVLAFIYSRCSDPNGCPLSLGLLYDLRYVAETDPEVGKSLRLVALSFDPAHDTPEVMAKFGQSAGAEQSGAADPLFLTTASEAELAPILAAYDQPVGRKADAGDSFGPLTHQLRVYLVDRQRRVRNIYSLGFLDPRLVVTDLRTLLLEEREGNPGG